jgi:hypothetical protein
MTMRTMTTRTTVTTMTRHLVWSIALLAACGGKQKNDVDDSGSPLIDTSYSSGDSTDRSGMVVNQDKMDEINRLLDRRRNLVSRCLAMAIENGDAPKSARAKITLAISISPAGKATSVEVIKTSLDVPSVKGCVKRKVEEIAFPTLPKQYDTSYTYAMEAN